MTMNFLMILKSKLEVYDKIFLHTLIPLQQAAYVENKFIGESSISIADIIEITDVLMKEGFLVTVDIEKAFISLDHTFIIFVLYCKNFVSCIETLILKQEFYTINGGNATQCFHLERGARQSDSTFAFVFILALEVLYFLFRNNTKIQGLKIIFFYTAYADDTAFFY